MTLDPIAFQKTYLYETRASLPRVLEDLKVLGSIDALAERRRRRLWASAW
ncbi:hypothetical protein [Corallococcus terminator]|nr:hypothetical protein [Corallococcus terminator]